MKGWFELHRSSDGQFHFVLKAGNAEVISQLYASQAAREAGINSVKANGQATTVKDQTGG